MLKRDKINEENKTEKNKLIYSLANSIVKISKIFDSCLYGYFEGYLYGFSCGLSNRLPTGFLIKNANCDLELKPFAFWVLGSNVMVYAGSGLNDDRTYNGSDHGL